MQHFSDRLAKAIRARRSVVCVGSTPCSTACRRSCARSTARGRRGRRGFGRGRLLPGVLRRDHRGRGRRRRPVKPQAAFFEQYGAPGWRALAEVVPAPRARAAGDRRRKRGDIASTGRPTPAAFGGAPGSRRGPRPRRRRGDRQPVPRRRLPDAVLEHCAAGRGVFVLTRTSNPGAALLQEKEVDGRPLYLRVADLVAGSARARRGRTATATWARSPERPIPVR